MIFWLSFSIFAFFLTLESVTSWFFIRGSKKKHPDLWLHAGEPTLMGNSDLVSEWPINKYLIYREYLEIDNKEAIMFAEKMRLPVVVSYFLAALSAINVLICIFVFGKTA